MTLDAIDFSQLRAFQLVAAHGSIRMAAAHMHLTVPAISAKIRTLEERLGIPLFQRLPNRLVLTRAGEHFVGEVDRIFDVWHATVVAVTSQEIRAGKISLSIGSDYLWFFAPKLKLFLDNHPLVEVGVRVYKSNEALQALQKGQLDLAMGIFPQLPPGIERVGIAPTALTLLYNNGAFPSQHPPSLAELTRGRVFVPPRGTASRRLAEAALGPAARRSSAIIECPTCDTAATFVQHGLGTAVVHTLCVSGRVGRDLRGLELGQPEPELQFSAVLRADSPHHSLPRALAAELT